MDCSGLSWNIQVSICAYSVEIAEALFGSNVEIEVSETIALVS